MALSSSFPNKDELAKMSRPEIQALCKENKLRALGTTDKLIDSLLVHFSRGDGSNHSTTDGRKSSLLTPHSVSKRLPAEAPPPSISAPRRLSSRPTSRNAARTSTLPPPTPSLPSPRPFVRTVSASKSRFIEEGLTSGNHLAVPPPAAPRRLKTPPDSANKSSDRDGSLSPVIKDGILAEPIQSESGRRTSSKVIRGHHSQDPSGATTYVDTETSASPSTSPRSKIAVELTIVDSGKLVQPSPGAEKVTTKNVRSPVRQTSSTVQTPLVRKPSLPPPPPSKSPGPTKASISRTVKSSSKPAPPLPPSHSILSGLESKLESYTQAVRASEERMRIQQIETTDTVRKLHNRIDAQETVIQTQQQLIEELRQALMDTHELAVHTRQSITDVRVDASSCVSQISFFSTSVSNLTKRTIAMEREVLQDGGKLPRLEKNLGDVDVAIESERDRVTDLEHKVTSLQKELELLGISGQDGFHGLSAEHARSRMSSLGGMSAVSGPMSRNGGTPNMPDLGRLARPTHHSGPSLSRASISSGLHPSSIPSAAPSPHPLEPSITITGTDTPLSAPENQVHRANLRTDFEFPPKRPSSATLPNGTRHVNGNQPGSVFPRQSAGMLGMNANRSIRSMMVGQKSGLSGGTPPLSRKTSAINDNKHNFIGEEPDLDGSPGWDDSIDGSVDLKGEIPPQPRRRPGGGRKGNPRSFAASDVGDSRSIVSSFSAMSVSISDLDRMGDDDDHERRAFVLASQREEDESDRNDTPRSQSDSDDDESTDADGVDRNMTVVLTRPPSYNST